tara:strand:- start:9 stop:632 length:624 start_codon:yes stop_codon:yes gene_type:complete
MGSDNSNKERRTGKRVKPSFVVKESHNKSRVKKRWRFPRGRHSQVRQMHKGKPAMPNPGYGAPKSEKGLHRSGLEPIIIHNSRDLLALTVNQGAIIASTVGRRKKLDLLQLAEEKKVSVLNVKDLAKLKAKINEEFAARKKAKSEKLKAKSKKQEAKEKKAAEKKKESEEKKEQKKEQKKEMPVEEKVKEEERKQKEIAEKTITKKQ